MLASLGCIQIKLGSTADNFDAVSDEFLQDRLQGERLRHAMDQSNAIDVKSFF